MSRATARVLLLGAVLAGCDGSSHRVPLSTSPPVPPDPASCPVAPSGYEPGDPAPRRAITTAEGVMLSYPVWLDLHPSDYDAMIDEIKAAGTPAGTTLVVLDPGAYYTPSSPTGLAAGEWRAPSTIYVAWRGTPSGARLPALDHEIEHVRTHDPQAGHK